MNTIRPRRPSSAAPSSAAASAPSMLVPPSATSPFTNSRASRRLPGVAAAKFSRNARTAEEKAISRNRSAAPKVPSAWTSADFAWSQLRAGHRAGHIHDQRDITGHSGRLRRGGRREHQHEVAVLPAGGVGHHRGADQPLAQREEQLDVASGGSVQRHGELATGALGGQRMRREVRRPEPCAFGCADADDSGP